MSCCKEHACAVASWVTEPTHDDLPSGLKSKPMLPGLMLNASSEGWRALKLLGRQAAMSHHRFMQWSACHVDIHRYETATCSQD